MTRGTFLSNDATTKYYAYLGPLGEIVRHGSSFFARRDGFLTGTYNTLKEAMESLEWKAFIHTNDKVLR
jgi:hypothetical protein